MRITFLLASAVALAAAVACSSGSSSPSNQQTGADASSSSSGGETYDFDGGDTWDNWAQGFFTKYCVECHAASNPDGLDFGQQSIVVQNAATIRCGVCVTQDPSWSCPANLPAKQFPISDTAGTNPKPTDEERDRVVAWIDAGTP